MSFWAIIFANCHSPGSLLLVSSSKRFDARLTPSAVVTTISSSLNCPQTTWNRAVSEFPKPVVLWLRNKTQKSRGPSLKSQVRKGKEKEKK